MTKPQQWQKRLKEYSYSDTARAFKIVERLWPRNSALYIVVANELHRKARSAFLQVARKRIIQPEREDFVAECMAKMSRGIDGFRPGNFHNWLATIARNVAVDAWRKDTRRRKVIPAILSLDEMGEAEVSTRDRAEHDAAIATDQHAEEEAIVADFLRRVEDELGLLARGVLEMKMSGVADEHIADYYGLEPLGVGAIIEQVAHFYTGYCAA